MIINGFQVSETRVEQIGNSAGCCRAGIRRNLRRCGGRTEGIDARKKRECKSGKATKFPAIWFHGHTSVAKARDSSTLTASESPHPTLRRDRPAPSGRLHQQ